MFHQRKYETGEKMEWKKMESKVDIFLESWNPNHGIMESNRCTYFLGDFAGGKTIPHQLPGPDGNMAVTFTTDEARRDLLHERSSMEVGEGFDAQLQRFVWLFFYIGNPHPKLLQNKKLKRFVHLNDLNHGKEVWSDTKNENIPFVYHQQFCQLGCGFKYSWLGRSSPGVSDKWLQGVSNIMFLFSP